MKICINKFAFSCDSASNQILQKVDKYYRKSVKRLKRSHTIKFIKFGRQYKTLRNEVEMSDALNEIQSIIRSKK